MTEITTALDNALRARSGLKGSYRKRHGCPAWCETSDHEQGERRHRRYLEVVCSLHPLEYPDVEGARAKMDPGASEWHQQNHSMAVWLEYPPGACEPYLTVEGHQDGDGQPRAQETRLSLAEGAELARILTEMVATGRATE